jgi:hypothetical protein
LRVRALKPAPRDKWYCDGDGLYLRVRATGGRSWVLRRKRGGHVEVITVGAWPALGLAQARQKAGALAGKDVSTLTLGALLDTWHADIVRKTYRRPREVRGYIERLDRRLRSQSFATWSASRCGTRCAATPRSVRLSQQIVPCPS